MRSDEGSITHLARRSTARVLSSLSERVFPEAGPGDLHWQRVALNRAVDDFIADLDPSGLSAIEISGDFRKGSGWKEFTATHHPEFDICEPMVGRGSYDVVICEQVLEHVVDPAAAAANLKLLARRGGRVIVSTPFLIRIHELPMFGMRDYWRFTPRGLGLLLENAGLEIISLGSWGNHEAIIGNLDRWAAHKRWHPMTNEPDLPVQVWAFARNPD